MKAAAINSLKSINRACLSNIKSLTGILSLFLKMNLGFIPSPYWIYFIHNCRYRSGEFIEDIFRSRVLTGSRNKM